MNLAIVLLVVLSTAPSVRSILRCSKCEDNCTRREIDQSAKVLFSNAASSFIGKDEINRSLAPWTYKENFNATRLPKTIWTASCNHRLCRNDTLLGFKPHLRVLDIKYNIRVYYREPCRTASHYRLVPETFSVTVGCTCIATRAS
ncbi:interleukin-17A-like [Anguilla anguilla]|uniref:interleukin-17A-like n=1 Tax=Anguilla anguilla TaxID=7936 RepID=UPI0015A9ED6D|nr:interleukin-17A-like [Anguilla anguilla]